MVPTLQSDHNIQSLSRMPGPQGAPAKVTVRSSMKEEAGRTRPVTPHLQCHPHPPTCLHSLVPAQALPHQVPCGNALEPRHRWQELTLLTDPGPSELHITSLVSVCPPAVSVQPPVTRPFPQILPSYKILSKFFCLALEERTSCLQPTFPGLLPLGALLSVARASFQQRGAPSLLLLLLFSALMLKVLIHISTRNSNAPFYYYQ